MMERRRNNRTVLVVDDNRDSLQLIDLLLRVWGYRVALAYDGPSALALARALQPVVVLLDIGLPGMDGYKVARRLRSVFPGVVLIAVTGRSREADRELTRKAGFDHHLVKPVEPVQLRRLIGEPMGSAPVAPA